MKFMHALAGAIALAFLSAPALAYEDAARPEAMVATFAPENRANVKLAQNRKLTRMLDMAPRGDLQAMISNQVCARIGCGWTSTALRIAHIESRFRCNARNRRAVGIFQTTNPAAFGVSRAAALTCHGGIVAGVEHMRACIAKGAATASQMMRCHNSGSPWGRVERAYRIALRGR